MPMRLRRGATLQCSASQVHPPLRDGNSSRRAVRGLKATATVIVSLHNGRSDDGLPAAKSGARMLFVMANRDDANAIRKNPVKEVIWEPPQVRPAQITKGRMKPQ